MAGKSVPRYRHPDVALDRRTEPGAGECMLWSGSMASERYGQISCYYKKMLAHRVAWEIANARQIPDGKIVHHKCDNGRCVNPSHLTLVGVTKHARLHAKLTMEEVRKIRALYDSTGLTYEDLGNHFGVAAPTIGRIIRRETWKEETV